MLHHDVGMILDHMLPEVEMVAVVLNHKNQPSAGLAVDRTIQVEGYYMMGMTFALDGRVMKKILGTVQRSSWQDIALKAR